jgi:hypothetical protein
VTHQSNESYEASRSRGESNLSTKRVELEQQIPAVEQKLDIVRASSNESSVEASQLKRVSRYESSVEASQSKRVSRYESKRVISRGESSVESIHQSRRVSPGESVEASQSNESSVEASHQAKRVISRGESVEASHQ